MKSNNFRLFLLSIAIFTTQLASAVEYYVEPADGTSSGGSGTEINPWNGFGDINAADWAAMAAGSTLYICGTHEDMLDVGANAITIDGACPNNAGVIDRSIDLKSIPANEWVETSSGSKIWEHKEKLKNNKTISYILINGRHGHYESDPADLDSDGDWHKLRTGTIWPYNVIIQLYAEQNPSTYSSFETIHISEPATREENLSDPNDSHDPAETGILVAGQDNVTIQNMIIQRVGRGARFRYLWYGQRGAVVISNSDNARILNNKFYDNGAGIQTYGINNDTEISGNSIHGLYVIHNDSPTGSIGIASGGNGAIISNNVVDGTIQFYDHSLFSSGRGIVMQMNHYPDFYSHNTKVFGNEVRNLGGFAIRAYNTVDPTTYDGAVPVAMKIYDNYIHYTDADVDNGQEEDGISFGSAFGSEFIPPVELDQTKKRFFGDPVLVHHNRIEGMQNTGIQVTNNWSNIDIYNNVISHVGQNEGISSGAPAIDTKHGNRIKNNTIYDTTTAAIRVFGTADFVDPQDPPVILNNIVYKTHDADGAGGSIASAIYFETQAAASQFTVNNNLYWDIDYSQDTFGVQGDQDSISADPILLNLKARQGNFRLGKGSPTIDAANADTVDDDFDNMLRDSVADIGAYEYTRNYVNYGFDDSNTIAHDSSDYGNHGTQNLNVTWTNNGLVDGAINFAGPNWQQYVRLDNGTNIYDNTNFTFSGWIKFDQVGVGKQRLIELPGMILRTDNDKFNFLVREAGPGNNYPWYIQESTSVLANRWYHAAATFEQQGSDFVAKLYVDGELVGTQIKTNIPDIPSTGSLYIGRANTRASIDETKYFANALSPTQVKALYLEPNLRGSWSFNEDASSGNTLEDASIYGNDGVLITSGATRSHEGKNGHSLKIDSNWDGGFQVGSPDSLQNHGEMTIFAWLLMNEEERNQYIVNQGGVTGGFFFYLNTSNQLSLVLSDGSSWQDVTASIEASAPLFDQKIFHMVAASVNSNNEVKLYLDGELIHSQVLAASFVPANNTGNFQIGLANTSAYVDEVKFYSTALSDDDIEQRMRQSAKIN